jgi:hypothetical protein
MSGKNYDYSGGLWDHRTPLQKIMDDQSAEATNSFLNASYYKPYSEPVIKSYEMPIVMPTTSMSTMVHHQAYAMHTLRSNAMFNQTVFR